MDKAKIGYCRVGHFHIGVTIDFWDRFVNRLENTSPKGMGGIDPAVWYSCRWYYFRWHVLLPQFDAMVQELEKHG